MATSYPALKPGATIGILGGGQLGRMLALAAARLGLRCHIYSPEPDSCAFSVVRRATVAEYGDEGALERFAREVDVVTYEFENVPAATASFLASRKPVVPDPSVLATTQDRVVEKDFVRALKIATAPYAAIASKNDIAGAVRKVGLPAVLKTSRLGYDGKGQRMLSPRDDPAAAWRELGEVPCVLEGFVDFAREVSVVAARSREGEVQCFDVTENEHRHHILKTSRVPARISAALARRAMRVAGNIAQAFDYAGVLTVEMFVVGSGKRERLLVNEIAPRVHNSGHWTLDGATVSQFEQHIRAVAGWPLAKPLRHRAVEMTNLIGAEVEDYSRYLTRPGTFVHLYGKTSARAERKMGHVTRILPAKKAKAGGKRRK